MSLFTETEKREITAAIRAAEAGTAGELALVLVERSDDYAAIRGAWALALSVAFAPEIMRLVPWLETHWVPWLFACALLSFYFVLGRGPLLRLVVPERVREARALGRALRAFTEEGVTETQARSGVLIFLSAIEHRVIILADQGIHARVSAGEWERDVESLVTGLKTGRAAKSLVEVIERIGTLLSVAFPADAQNDNELPDELRER